MDDMTGRARARCSREVTAGETGFITAIDAFAAGRAGVVLGVGRDTAADPVEPLAGIEFLKKTGQKVSAGECVMRLWAEEEGRLQQAEDLLDGSVVIRDAAPEERSSLILEEITTA